MSAQNWQAGERRWRRLWFWPSPSWLLLVIGSLGFGVLLIISGLAHPASNLAYDGLSRAIVRVPSSDVVVVAIDDESINRVGAWPWPRSTHAALIQQLTKAHARAILYDVLFVEPGEGDAALGAAIRAGPPTVVPLLYEIPGENGRAISVRSPVPLIASPNLMTGHAVLSVDADGISRRVRLIDQVDGQAIAHVALLAARRDGNGSDPEALIAYAPRGSLPTVSFSAVLNGSVPPEFLANKIILVGATAAGLGDRYATPVSRDGALTPGVEVLANIVGNVRDARLIVDSGFPGSLVMLAIPLLGLALAFLRFTPRVNVVVALVLVAATLGVSGIALAWGWWVDPAPSLIAMFVLFPAWGWYRLGRATAMIDTQIVALRDEGNLLYSPMRTVATGGDRLARQVTALETAIARNVDLRQFVQISFESLPDAAIVARAAGPVVLANARAQQLYRDYTGVSIPAAGRDVVTGMIGHIAEGRDALELMFRPAPVGDSVAVAEIRTTDDRFFQLNRANFVSATRRDAFVIVRMVETTARRRAERERGQAIEFLSHDLRAPQASILGLLDSPSAIVDPVLQSRLRVLAARTLAMAQAFIDIARAQGDSLELTPVDLTDVAQEAAEALWGEATGKRVQITLHHPDSEVMIMGDRLLLSRAIGNLIGNALSVAAPDSQISVVIRLIGNEDEPRYVRCNIDDRGPGIARDRLPKIFDRFATTGKATGATGLGLAMVKVTVERFGGTVAVYSRMGIGTRFIMKFPRSDAGN